MIKQLQLKLAPRFLPSQDICSHILVARPSLRLSITTDKRVFRYRKSSVWRLLQASDYCPALFRCLNCAHGYSQRFDYHVLGSGRKLGGAAEDLIDGSEKRICRLSLSFRVRMFLKGAVNMFSVLPF